MIPSHLPNEEELKISTLEKLELDGYIICEIKQIYSNVLINNLAITLKGENALSNSLLKNKLLSAIHNITSRTWSFILIIAATVIGGILLKYLI